MRASSDFETSCYTSQHFNRNHQYCATALALGQRKTCRHTARTFFRYDIAMSKNKQDKAAAASKSEPDSQLEVVEQVDPSQLQHFVTTIKTAEQQVGENIIQALQHDGTVAVLTTVVVGPDGQQRVVSAALKPEMMQQVQNILMEAQEDREEEEPCVGFHCLVKPKQEVADSGEEKEESPKA